MSTFSGILKEIKNVSIDRFDNENLQSKYFFLSHCHMDHMIGLNRIGGLPGPLYTSSLSAVLVKHQFPEIKNIISLEIGVATSIDNVDEANFVVTAIPAGHCPGSVMFFFEKFNQRILYTGDFRISLNSLKRIETFKLNSELLKIDTIYLDSTFFNKKYLEFPTQFESVKQICQLIKEWIDKGKNYIISIKIPARYGSEYLYIQISKQTKMKIHVNRKEFELYNYIPEMDGCITDDPNDTQIHACVANVVKNYKTLNCIDIDDLKYLRVIRPSALIWTQWNTGKEFIEKLPSEIYRICYSSHSSFNEIKDMILYLKPINVEFNVIPNETEKKTMIDILRNEILIEYKDKPRSLDVQKKINNINFNNISKNTIKTKMKCLSDSEDDEIITLSIPVKKIKTE